MPRLYCIRGFERGGRTVSISWNDGRNAGGLSVTFMNRLHSTSYDPTEEAV